MFLEELLLEVRRVTGRLADFPSVTQIRGVESDLTALGNRIEDEIRRVAAGRPGLSDTFAADWRPGDSCAEEVPNARAAFNRARMAYECEQIRCRLDAHDVRLSRVETAVGVK